MNIEMWLAFTVASTLLLIVPGPTILTVISYSMSHGYKAQIPLVVAVALGDSTALALSILGLGILLAESTFWFQIIKGAGGLYLLYLGVKLLRTGIKPLDLSQQEAEPGSSRNLFFNTYLVTALNPKGIIFFVAFFPQFIDATANITSQLWVLAITFVVLSVINASSYVFFASKAQRMLSTKKANRVFNFMSGSLLSVAGLWALSARQT